MNEDKGVPLALRRRVVNGSDGFLALNRLNTSAIASTWVSPSALKLRLTLRFNCENGARRLQLTVLHGPASSYVATPMAFKPVYRYASAVLSFRLLSALRSSPSNEWVGSADRYTKI